MSDRHTLLSNMEIALITRSLPHLFLSETYFMLHIGQFTCKSVNNSGVRSFLSRRALSRERACTLKSWKTTIQPTLRTTLSRPRSWGRLKRPTTDWKAVASEKPGRPVHMTLPQSLGIWASPNPHFGTHLQHRTLATCSCTKTTFPGCVKLGEKFAFC